MFTITLYIKNKKIYKKSVDSYRIGNYYSKCSYQIGNTEGGQVDQKDIFY